MEYSSRTSGTCSQLITFDLNENKLSNIKFYGGCDGNLKAISTLVDGWTVEEIESKLTGIHCGPRSTSCGDQLAQAVRAAANEEAKRQ